MARIATCGAVIGIVILVLFGFMFARNDTEVALDQSDIENQIGSNRIGFKTIQTRGLNLAVWYPADRPEQNIEIGPFVISAAPNAPVAPGRYGLVIVSHGTGGNILGHRGTAAELARQDHIVVAVEHSGSNWRDVSKVGTQSFWQDRPQEISKTLDLMLADEEFAPYIDQDVIIGMGYSGGGYSVLAAALGGSYPSIINQHCSTAHADTAFCQLPEPVRAGVGELVDIEQPVEERLSCLVLVAPIGVVFKKASFEKFNLPLLLFRMATDNILSYPFHAENIHKLVHTQHSYKILNEGNHYSFIEPFPHAIRKSVGAPAQDPKGFDRKKFLQNVNETISAFAKSQC